MTIAKDLQDPTMIAILANEDKVQLVIKAGREVAVAQLCHEA